MADHPLISYDDDSGLGILSAAARTHAPGSSAGLIHLRAGTIRKPASENEPKLYGLRLDVRGSLPALGRRQRPVR